MIWQFWRMFGVLQMQYTRISCPWSKNRILHLNNRRPSSSRKSGFFRSKWRRRTLNLICEIKSWRKFFGLQAVQTTSITFKRKVQVMANIVQIHCTGSTIIWRKSNHIWSRKKWSFTNATLHIFVDGLVKYNILG